MPDWPHEYIVRSKVDENLFLELAIHIREYGNKGLFYEKTLTYFCDDGLIYWTMGDSIELTTFINRCLKENSNEEKLKKGTLPKILNRQTIQ